jgi:hypothetical protein
MIIAAARGVFGQYQHPDMVVLARLGKMWDSMIA